MDDMLVAKSTGDAQSQQDAPASSPGQSSPLTYHELMKQVFENAASRPEFPHTNNNDDDDDFDDDCSNGHQSVLSHVLPQMMFVSGETAEPSVETTGMIEQIVREQVVEMVSILRQCQSIGMPTNP